MVLIHIGTGGWAYLDTKERDRLAAYSKLFNFVEVNSTFYVHPRLTLVQSWRKRVSSEFVFSVRCHRDLTHKFGLVPYEEAFQIFERMMKICKILRAPILHLETPSLLQFNKEKIRLAKEFFGSIMPRDVKLAFEVRSGLNEDVLGLMQDSDLIPCVDLSREKMPIESDILYSRLFGKGTHTLYQFDDDELMEIENKATLGTHRRTFLVFHSLRMYEDAHRLKVHMESGKFPKPKEHIGIESLKKILSQIRFPCSKQEIIQQHGWMVVNMSSGKRIHVSSLLQNLHDGIYTDIDQIVKEVMM
ncbi:MAG: DUF72 domain-containing protein [archaeon]|nr:DUF72 domain-containing protein [archaeon]